MLNRERNCSREATGEITGSKRMKVNKAKWKLSVILPVRATRLRVDLSKEGMKAQSLETVKGQYSVGQY